MNIDKARFERFEKAHLLSGNHLASPEIAEKACAMEWAAYLANEPHSDSPTCVDRVIRGYVISLNDNWTDAERDRLKPYIPRTLGTRSTAGLETKRAVMALDWTFRVHRPIWLEAAGLAEHAAKMRALPEIVDEATSSVAVAAQAKAIGAARAAWAARDARGAWDAWDAVGVLVVINAGNSLGPDATDDQRHEVGIAALNSVAQSVRDAELVLLERMIEVA
jgi:hypothetical protein